MTDDELKRLFEVLRLENAAAHTDTRRQFEVIAEALEKRVAILGESVTAIDEKVTGGLGSVRDSIERTAADTQAMIKFSYAELNRRVRTLEETVSALQVRVERIESSTHCGVRVGIIGVKSSGSERKMKKFGPRRRRRDDQIFHISGLTPNSPNYRRWQTPSRRGASIM